MTLRELKNKKVFPSSIKDSYLIEICNEVLKPAKEIKSIEFQLGDELIDKVLYSKKMIDFIVNKMLNNKDKPRVARYVECIDYLTKVNNSLSNNKSMNEEFKYISEVISKLNKEKKYYETMDAMAENNKDAFMSVDPNNLTKLNKEGLAAMMGVLLGEQAETREMLVSLFEQVKQLNSKVDSLTSGVKKEAPALLELPPKPDLVSEVTPAVNGPQNVQASINGPSVSSRGTNGMPMLFPMGSLHDLITRNVLPKVDENQLLDYCNKVLGINAKDMKFVPSASQLDRLKESAFISSNIIRGDIRSQHKGVADKYSALISSYQGMIDDMRDKAGFEKDIASLESLIDKISKKRDEYNQVIEGFESADMEQYFQFGASRFQDKMGTITSEQQKELSDIDDSLKQLVDRKNALEKADYKHLFARMKNKRDLKKVVSKINRLKTKQGRIKTSQKKIVDIYTSKYVKKMEKEFDKFVKEQEKLSIEYQKKQSQLVDLNEKQKKMDRLSRKMVDIQEKRKNANRVVQVGLDSQTMGLESRKKLLQARIDSLQGKVGSVDLSKQYSTTFNREYAFAL